MFLKLTPSQVGGCFRRMGTALTKADLAKKVADDCGFMKGETSEIVEKVMDLIKSRLIAVEDVMISGFGKWSLKSEHSKRGRNPCAGEDMTLNTGKLRWKRFPIGNLADFPAELRLILSCLHVSPDEDDSARIRKLSMDLIDWDHFPALVNRHKVAPLGNRSPRSLNQRGCWESGSVCDY